MSNGHEAVRSALQGGYDVVLMDCQMPELDGLEATRQLRLSAATADLPVVALTAGVTEDERRACREAGMTGWLTKPLLLADLQAQARGRDSAGGDGQAVTVRR